MIARQSKVILSFYTERCTALRKYWWLRKFRHVIRTQFWSQGALSSPREEERGSWCRNHSMSMGGIGGRPIAFTQLTILINLFIKNFYPTSPVKYCFCLRVFSRLQEGFWRGGQGEYILPDKWAWNESKIEVGHFRFMCFAFANMLFCAVVHFVHT